MRNIAGAILFRGFPVKTAEDLSKITKAFKFPQPHQEVGLSGKRSTVGDNVKTANEEPSHVKFYFHDEYGRSAHFPGIVFFNSQIVPDEGGQTPLLSTIELYDRVRDELPEFVNDLTENCIIGRQYYPDKQDPEAKTIGWNWQDSYGFDIEPSDALETQRRKVEHVLESRLKAEAEWQPNGALHVLQRLPAVRRIESTGQPVLFNGLGATLYSWTCLVDNRKTQHTLPGQPLKADREFTSKDVTIILPTVQVSDNPNLRECLETCFTNNPKGVFIITDNQDRAKEVNDLLLTMKTDGVQVKVSSADVASKRHQMLHLVNDVKTPLICYLDDHVFLPPTFLEKVLPEFKDENVGLCGTMKSVRREDHLAGGPYPFLEWLKRWWKAFWNFLGRVYLERHNTDLSVTDALDNSHFVISGRAMLIEAPIMKDPEFQDGFKNEMKRFFFWTFGPIAAGDDNYITRWVRRIGKKIVFSRATEIQTTLGVYPKFIFQCLRWKRTTIVNADVLTEPSLWRQAPWTIWVTYIPMLTNGALFWDSFLVYLLWGSKLYSEANSPGLLTFSLMLFIYLAKAVRIVRLFRDHPGDFFLFFLPIPAYLLFIYFHSLISIWAYLTWWDRSWSGRKLNAKKN
ncbi:uncharacterized protein DNG_10258 [Cephalotrichum gorgonifer]|uniref:TauD/TfdA-like domain-containing protein n=1 Tax=Cephalotrichum gorgonifer TaxID=2041049 RepID=A0AAE8N8Q0_9PEZI|nr:uncharacterized protein DNG_10258 [Cephalotrichum gorgonifer]